MLRLKKVKWYHCLSVKDVASEKGEMVPLFISGFINTVVAI